MTDQQHPITPPHDQVYWWWEEACKRPPSSFYEKLDYVAAKAAQCGADLELEACCDWVFQELGYDIAIRFQAARRPKPPSLAEEALALINHDPENQPFLSEKGIAILRRALKRLQELEGQK